MTTITAQATITPPAAQGNLEIKTDSNRKRAMPSDKATLIAKRLVTNASTEAALCYCPITGLTVAHDLPPSIEVMMIMAHPLAFNSIALLQHPSYIKELSNEHLSGLILGLLNEAGKLSITSRSNALLVRAKLEVIASKNQLLDIIEWIANSLLTTKLYYPSLVTDHTKLTLESLTEWMEWTYSIEVYSFDGSKPERVKEPKQLTISNPETRIKRLSKQFDSSLAELISAIDDCPDLTIMAAEELGERVLVNLSPLLKGAVDKINPKLDALLERIGTISELADIVADLTNYRKAALSLLNANQEAVESMLDSYFEAAAPANEAPAEVAEPASKPATNSFAAKLAALKAKGE